MLFDNFFTQNDMVFEDGRQKKEDPRLTNVSRPGKTEKYTDLSPQKEHFRCRKEFSVFSYISSVKKLLQ